MALRLTVRSAEGRPLPEELRYDLEQDRVTLGRSVGADVRLPHATVSEQHAIVRLESSGYVLVDGESTNGTRVNGDKLVAGRKKKLQDGDRIEIGVYAILFEARGRASRRSPRSAPRSSRAGSFALAARREHRRRALGAAGRAHVGKSTNVPEPRTSW